MLGSLWNHQDFVSVKWCHQFLEKCHDAMGWQIELCKWLGKTVPNQFLAKKHLQLVGETGSRDLVFSFNQKKTWDNHPQVGPSVWNNFQLKVFFVSMTFQYNLNHVTVFFGDSNILYWRYGHLGDVTEMHSSRAQCRCRFAWMQLIMSSGSPGMLFLLHPKKWTEHSQQKPGTPLKAWTFYLKRLLPKPMAIGLKRLPVLNAHEFRFRQLNDEPWPPTAAPQVSLHFQWFWSLLGCRCGCSGFFWQGKAWIGEWSKLCVGVV